MHQIDERFWGKRLAQEPVRPCGIKRDGFLLHVAAVKDGFQRGMDFLAMLNQFAAGHLRHLKISQQQRGFGVRLADCLERDFRIGKQDGFKTTQFQNRLDDIADHRFVIHYIDKGGFPCGGRAGFCVRLTHPVEGTFIFNPHSVNYSVFGSVSSFGAASFALHARFAST